ncbi:MAG: phage tail tape measure protein [Thermoanaerobacteraceae bacterium]|nr:phage tail tape measure protein [Thermoanaerobacteraceae bacterium]
MAESEIYRVEIPIIVDDQSETPLERARERVNRFEKEARKRNEMIQKHFQSLAKLKIEPMMRVKDQLTASVLKADRLVKRLGMEQASPILAVQDRVSAVVARVDAALQALDQGKVEVLADMKGTLMDEIVKAKAALSALNDVKTGPIAELRGELFGQLAKAMSQLRDLERIRARPQATLRERVMWKAKEIGNILQRLTSRTWTLTLSVKDKVTGTMKKVGHMLSTPLGLLGLGGLTIGPVGLIGSAIKTAAEFEQSLANVQSVAGATREELALLRETALSAGRETIFKASEAADALYYLASAGFNVQQQVGALRGTLALAAATQSDLAFTSETMAGTISAFGLRAEEADRVANAFAATISNSQATINKLADSMRYAGPAAAGFGRSLEETMAVLALFYNMNLTGEMAGTRFRSALSALAHPAGETKKALAALGISAKQVDPNLHSLADIIDLLKAKGVDTTMAMRLFGQETGPAMAKLIEMGGNAIRKMERKLTGTNKAFEMAAMQTDTLIGTQRMLQSVWESVNITLGTQSIPGLRRLVEWMYKTIGSTDELAKKIGQKLNRAFEWLADMLESPGFKEADLIGKLVILLEAGTPKIFEVGSKLGARLAKGIAEGLGSAILEDKWTALVFGILAGMYTPGPIRLKVAIAVSIIASPWVKDFLEWITTDAPKRSREVTEGITKYRALPGTSAYAGAKIAETSKAWQWFEEKRRTTAPGEPMIKGTTIGPAKHAAGGLFNRPHLALVAEAGPEAIIPLSARMRSRALALYEETGRRLGVRPYAEGGFTARVPAFAGAVAAPSAMINMHFDLKGLVGQVVVNKGTDIEAAIDRITSVIADNLHSVFQNMART